MNARGRAALSILIVAALVVACDVALIPIRQSAGKYPYDRMSIILELARCFATVAIAGLAGLFLAPRVGSPVWWRPGDGSPGSRRVTLITAVLSLVSLAYNTLIVVVYSVAYPDHMVAVAPWITELTPGIAIIASMRAALYQETVWRLFLFPLASWGLLRFLRSRRISLIIGAVVPTLFFGLAEPGFLPAFLIGLALVYIYHHRGLLPAMVVHFFTDAIPYVLGSVIL